MPLVRSNDIPKLSQKFTLFSEKLEDCIRRDLNRTRDYFPENSPSFLISASMYRADAVAVGLNSALQTTQPAFPLSFTNMLQARMRSGLFSPILTNMKSTILCAFELTNDGQRDRINKQQLYTFLFCMGFPVGLIAKIILNGNVGGVRNGVLAHTDFATTMLVTFNQGYRLDIVKKGFLGDENIGSSWYERFFAIASICYKVGGINLLEKFVNCKDQKDLLESRRALGVANNLTKYLLCYGDQEKDSVYRKNTSTLFEITFSARRGVRRTGQTLSRNETRRTTSPAVEVFTAQPSIQTPPARTQTPERVTQATETQVGSELLGLVRDSKFKNTLGIEIEYWDASFRELKEEFDKVKIPLYPRFLGYHESVNYDKYKEWRIMRDGSLRDRFGGGQSGADTGGEIVAPILVGERGLLTLARVLNVCQKVGITNNNSTGVHVHFGVKGYTGANRFEHAYDLKTIRNFICNYIGFEKIIDAYMRRSRRRNQNGYTSSPVLDIWRNKRLRDNGQDYENVTFAEIQELSSQLNAMSDSAFTSWANSTLARGKINPHSNGLAFSIEIRQHGGTHEKDTLLGWILFLHYLFELSKRRVATKFTWKNLRDNVLPKPLWSFMENRIIDMTGQIPDVYDLQPSVRPRPYTPNRDENNPL